MKKLTSFFASLLLLLALALSPAYATELLENPGLTVAAGHIAPTGWSITTNNTAIEGSATSISRTAAPSWYISGNGALWQDSLGWTATNVATFSAYMLVPSTGGLTGTRYGVLKLNYYNSSGGLISSSYASTSVTAATTADTWTQVTGTAAIPADTVKVRFYVYCVNPTGGTGKFYTDDCSLTVVNSTPTATGTPTFTPTSTNTPWDETRTPTLTSTVTKTRTATPTMTTTSIYAKTATPTKTISATSTISPTKTSVVPNTKTVTKTITVSPTPTRTPTFTATKTQTTVYSPTSTPTATATYTETPVCSPTFTVTATATATPITFAGGVYTQGNIVTDGGYFGITASSQGTTIPAITSGMFGFWWDSDASILYLVYNWNGSKRKVQLTP